MTLHKSKSVMDETDDSYTYNRARKYYLVYTGKISCTYCKYHRKENASRKQRNWKKLRKKKYIE